MVSCKNVSFTSSSELRYFNSDSYETHFTVSESNIKILPAFILEQVPKTSVLNMSKNFITTLETGAFNSLSNLREVNLQFNNISELQDGIFASNKALVKLDLSHNNISIVGDAFPVSSLAMKDLNLHDNKLRGLNFKLPKALQVLDLSSNLISSIERDVFFGMLNLNRLFLNGNRLKIIPLGCFRDLIHLRELNLAENEVAVTYGTFSGLLSLSNLNLASNSMEDLPELALNNLGNLTNLNLGNNSLSKIDSKALTKYLKSLQNIQLSGNKFSCQHLLGLITEFKERGIVVGEGKEIFSSNVKESPALQSEAKKSITPAKKRPTSRKVL